MKKQILLGLVGKSGSGKSTIASYLKTKSFYTVELSKYLKQEAKQRRILITKQALQDLGNELRRVHHADILVRWAIKELNTNKVKLSVVGGIRSISEVEYLRQNKQFYLVAVLADSKIRYQRIIKEKGIDWVGTYKNFLAVERRDSSLGNNKNGLRVSECLKMADYQIINNLNNPEVLQYEVDKIINKIMK